MSDLLADTEMMKDETSKLCLSMTFTKRLKCEKAESCIFKSSEILFHLRAPNSCRFSKRLLRVKTVTVLMSLPHGRLLSHPVKTKFQGWQNTLGFCDDLEVNYPPSLSMQRQEERCPWRREKHRGVRDNAPGSLEWDSPGPLPPGPRADALW